MQPNATSMAEPDNTGNGQRVVRWDTDPVETHELAPLARDELSDPSSYSLLDCALSISSSKSKLSVSSPRSPPFERTLSVQSEPLPIDMSPSVDITPSCRKSVSIPAGGGSDGSTQSAPLATSKGISTSKGIGSSSKTASRTFREIALQFRAAKKEISGLGCQKEYSGGAVVSTPHPDQAAKDYLRFSPAILQRQLHDIVANDGDITEPISEQYCMVLFLVDVSGFTRMTTELGAELTRSHCNAFFDQIITCIMQHGGDVLKFLGDALLVAWPAKRSASNATKRLIVAAAAACAIEIMTKLNGYRAATPGQSEDIVLTLHGALAIDEVHTFEVGDNDRRQFLIGGDVLSEIGGMEAAAHSGEVVVSAEFSDLLPEGCRGNLRNGHLMLDLTCQIPFTINATDLISEQLEMQYGKLDESSDVYMRLLRSVKRCRSILSAHVATVCRTAVAAGTLASLGEMRWVTTVFCGIDALIPHLNTGNVSLIQKAFLALLEAVRATGGALRQFVLDDKGCVAIFCWGVPGYAHGDREDCCRACECAGMILQSFNNNKDEFNLEHGPHMGIAAGDIYVGCIGAHHRCTYAMLGPSVNLAARLMSKAEGWHVLADQNVYTYVTGTGKAWAFDTASPIQAKGYDRKITVFRPQFASFKEDIDNITRRDSQAFILRWDRLETHAQVVGKVASVLAQGPHWCIDREDLCDFSLKALAHVMKEMKFASKNKSTREAVVILRASNIIRYTRGHDRQDLCYAFCSKFSHETISGLLPAEQAKTVHKLYADWIEAQLARAEMEAGGDDSAVNQARLKLLHYNLDAKHLFHREQAEQGELSEGETRVASGIGLDRIVSNLQNFACCLCSRPRPGNEP